MGVVVENCKIVFLRVHFLFTCSDTFAKRLYTIDDRAFPVHTYIHKTFIKKITATHQFHNEEMDKMQSKQHTLREETLTHNTLNCMVCLKKHPINKISVIMHTRKFKVMRPGPQTIAAFSLFG